MKKVQAFPSALLVHHKPPTNMDTCTYRKHKSPNNVGDGSNYLQGGDL